ncbi:MAG: hypothetical protein JWL77_3555 [Chthonomonadaceae bacterium]|nr:hypothetical protein [Chthonomonadaceae bacterium]
MSFMDDFRSCMSPLPIPDVDGLDEALEFVHKLHSAWENAGGNEEMLMAGLLAAGAVTGIDEGAIALLGTVTVLTYIAACVTCAVSAAGSSVWDFIFSSNTPTWLQDELRTAANDKGIAPPADATATA